MTTPATDLLPESADERRMVDEACAAIGWTPLQYVANSLYLEHRNFRGTRRN